MDREHEHRRTPRRDEPLFLALMAVNTSLETTRRALDLAVQQREQPREAETTVASEVPWQELFEVAQETVRTIEGELAEEHPWRVYAQGASVVVEQLAGLYSRFTQRRAADSRAAPRREPAAPHPRSRRRRRGGEG